MLICALLIFQIDIQAKWTGLNLNLIISINWSFEYIVAILSKIAVFKKIDVFLKILENRYKKLQFSSNESEKYVNKNLTKNRQKLVVNPDLI